MLEGLMLQCAYPAPCSVLTDLSTWLMSCMHHGDVLLGTFTYRWHLLLDGGSRQAHPCKAQCGIIFGHVFQPALVGQVGAVGLCLCPTVSASYSRNMHACSEWGQRSAPACR